MAFSQTVGRLLGMSSGALKLSAPYLRIIQFLWESLLPLYKPVFMMFLEDTGQLCSTDFLV